MSHPTHSTWLNKSFPFYGDLIIIFRKDQAIEINVEGPIDMKEDIQREETNNNADKNVEATMKIILRILILLFYSLLYNL